MLVSTLYRIYVFQCFLIFKCIFEAFRGISGSSFAWEGICKIFWTNQISTPECRELSGTYSIWGFKIVVLLYSEHFQSKRDPSALCTLAVLWRFSAKNRSTCTLHSGCTLKGFSQKPIHLHSALWLYSEHFQPKTDPLHSEKIPTPNHYYDCM